MWKLIHNYPTSIKSLVQRNVCREFLQLNSLSTYSLFDTSQTLDLAFRGSMGEINRNNRLNTQKRLNGSMRAASCSGALSLISQSLTNPLRLCPLQLLIPQSPFSLLSGYNTSALLDVLQHLTALYQIDGTYNLFSLFPFSIPPLTPSLCSLIATYHRF